MLPERIACCELNQGTALGRSFLRPLQTSYALGARRDATSRRTTPASSLRGEHWPLSSAEGIYPPRAFLLYDFIAVAHFDDVLELGESCPMAITKLLGELRMRSYSARVGRMVCVQAFFPHSQRNSVVPHESARTKMRSFASRKSDAKHGAGARVSPSD
jgi:hypothetical protein